MGSRTTELEEILEISKMRASQMRDARQKVTAQEALSNHNASQGHPEGQEDLLGDCRNHARSGLFLEILSSQSGPRSISFGLDHFRGHF